jgi:hypothetical protein
MKSVCLSRVAVIAAVGLTAAGALLAAAAPRGVDDKGLAVLADYEGAHLVVVEFRSRAAPDALPALETAFMTWRARNLEAQRRLQQRMLDAMPKKEADKAPPVQPETLLRMVQQQGVDNFRKAMRARSQEELQAFCAKGYAAGLAVPELDFAVMEERRER